ncbi:MAG: hypothetical protein NDJ89_07750 [Oligoflexia bacterium]|nr:hypothetical protein [Oligoflexia bacterium]
MLSTKSLLFALFLSFVLPLQARADAPACEIALAPLGKAALMAYCSRIVSPAEYDDLEPVTALELCVLRGPGKSASGETLVSAAVLFTGQDGARQRRSFTTLSDLNGTPEYQSQNGGFTLQKRQGETLVGIEYSAFSGQASYREISAVPGGGYQLRRSVRLSCYSVM